MSAGATVGCELEHFAWTGELKHHEVRRQRLSYGALIKVGTRSGRITSWVPIIEIV
jgi:hypothetical protein